jgi:hypothetical protein
MRFQVLTAVNMKMIVSWTVALRSLVEVYRRLICGCGSRSSWLSLTALMV